MRIPGDTCEYLIVDIETDVDPVPASSWEIQFEPDTDWHQMSEVDGASAVLVAGDQYSGALAPVVRLARGRHPARIRLRAGHPEQPTIVGRVAVTII